MPAENEGWEYRDLGRRGGWADFPLDNWEEFIVKIGDVLTRLEELPERNSYERRSKARMRSTLSGIRAFTRREKRFTPKQLSAVRSIDRSIDERKNRG